MGACSDDVTNAPADLLVLERGVPFAFVTGYDDILEPRHQDVPLVTKRSDELLIATLRRLVALDNPSCGSLPIAV
jgi:hypothetical protein